MTARRSCVLEAMIVASTLLTISGCTAARMAGFDALAARIDVEQIDVSAIPGWADGRFRFGGTDGYVRRFAASDAIGWGPDSFGSAFDAVRVGEAARFGTVEFIVERNDLGGRLDGRCRYARTEARDRLLGTDLATAWRRLRLRCVYRLNGIDAGRFELEAIPTGGGVAEPRRGFISMDGVQLGVRSTHALDGTSMSTSAPTGYLIEGEEDTPVAAVDLNGASVRHLLLPRSGSYRKAAAAALLTLALFWDPGDTG